MGGKEEAAKTTEGRGSLEQLFDETWKLYEKSQSLYPITLHSVVFSQVFESKPLHNVQISCKINAFYAMFYQNVIMADFEHLKLSCFVQQVISQVVKSYLKPL